MPERCPVCGGPVVREEGEAAYRCVGIECPAKLARSLEHFVSKDAMNIDGFGTQLVAVLLDAGLIKTIPDIYALASKKDELVALERIGEKSAANLLLSHSATMRAAFLTSTREQSTETRHTSI